MPVISDPVVQSYIAYSSILAVKVLLMSPLTGRLRFSKGVFANTEDTPLQQGSVVKLDDPDVERVRRAHRNDLENIPAFWVLGAFYVTTDPAAPLAINLFRAYTAGRIIHTIVYAVKPLPQPTRAIAYAVPTIIMWYMGYKVISYYFEAL